MDLHWKRTPEKHEPLSFVKLVKEHGDNWQTYLPRNVKYVGESRGPGFHEAIYMEWCERGVVPRIQSSVELFE
jgi:hypothetical protein